jgi:hypothetical protein
LSFAFLVLGLCLLVVPVAVFAQVDLGLEEAAAIGLSTNSITTIIGRIINVFFGLLGIILLVLYLYGGFLWMTAGGDDSKVQQAKQVLTNATIGLVIIMSAYAIAFFIVRAILGESILPGGIGGTRTAPSSFDAFRSGSSGELGNGIIEYHYPEVSQTDVPRNTKVSITFKKPLLLSTVFRDYDDGGTYELTDDTIGGIDRASFLAGEGNVLMLNTDNIKLIPVSQIADVSGDTPDDRFTNRYPAEFSLEAVARVTDVAVEFDPLQGQTIVIDPVELLGSSQADVDYRVAIRGAENGVLVWTPNVSTGIPETEPAFEAMSADGGYFWPFSTGTTLDLTPPQITYVGPYPQSPIMSGVIYRNELLQIYFNEAIDPTTASGVLGEGGGFTNIEVQARCLRDDISECEGVGTSFETVPGTLYIGNKYRTVEFVPDAPCESVRENSCGNPVYCLPPNTELRVRAIASELSGEPPAGLGNGVEDMVGNSLDGNDDTEAQGPATVELPDDYFRNDPQDDLTGVNDTARWMYHVGDQIDLTPPYIIGIDPVSHLADGSVDTNMIDYDEMGFETVEAEDFPPERDILAIWSKVMSVSSMRTGAYQGGDYVFADDRTTIALRASERLKDDFEEDCSVIDAPCLEAEPPLDPPWFRTSVGDGPVEIDGQFRTVMAIEHRIFFTGDDLGYAPAETALHPEFSPIYAPVLGAQLRDTRQNCFYPSKGYECGTGPISTSCCDRDVVDRFGGTITCD